MCKAAILKTMGIVLVLGVGLFVAAPVAHAGETCVQACADQWSADKQACQDRLDADLTQIAADEATCISGAATPIAQGQCIRKANTKRFVARRNYQTCVSRANTTAYNCYRNCQVSESRPSGARRGR